MSFDKLIAAEQRTQPWPFEIERDQIARMFRDAADRLEQMAAGIGAQQFWLREIREARACGHLSSAAVAWATTMGPVIAPVLVAELRSSAEHIASACMAAEVSMFSEGMAGLAERILAVKP